ncbi:uncharacterized protein BDW70DRAFT_128524 [Aspergillus foveolatus]|uniref:uncharacterized protein n=1 Tax=Aspergillus foveolatus TaxID=210207 RepID=UPI003CCE3891
MTCKMRTNRTQQLLTVWGFSQSVWTAIIMRWLWRFQYRYADSRHSGLSSNMVATAFPSCQPAVILSW